MEWLNNNQAIDFIINFARNALLWTGTFIIICLDISHFFNNIVSKPVLNAADKTKTLLDNQVSHISRPTIINSTFLITGNLYTSLILLLNRYSIVMRIHQAGYLYLRTTRYP